jgi:hypothetical protein
MKAVGEKSAANTAERNRANMANRSNSIERARGRSTCLLCDACHIASPASAVRIQLGRVGKVGGNAPAAVVSGAKIARASRVTLYVKHRSEQLS